MYNSGGLSVTVNEELRLAQTTVSKTTNVTAKTLLTLYANGTVPSPYRPPINLHMNDRQDAELRLNSGGGMDYYCSVGLTNYWIAASFIYNY